MQLIYQTGIQHPTVVRNSGASTGIFAKMSRSGNEVIGRFRLSPAFVGPSLWAYFFVHYAQNKEEGGALHFLYTSSLWKFPHCK